MYPNYAKFNFYCILLNLSNLFILLLIIKYLLKTQLFNVLIIILNLQSIEIYLFISNQNFQDIINFIICTKFILNKIQIYL